MKPQALHLFDGTFTRQRETQLIEGKPRLTESTRGRKRQRKRQGLQVFERNILFAPAPQQHSEIASLFLQHPWQCGLQVYGLRGSSLSVSTSMLSSPVFNSSAATASGDLCRSREASETMSCTFVRGIRLPSVEAVLRLQTARAPGVSPQHQRRMSVLAVYQLHKMMPVAQEAKETLLSIFRVSMCCCS